jgi:hypothetical protein
MLKLPVGAHPLGSGLGGEVGLADGLALPVDAAGREHPDAGPWPDEGSVAVLGDEMSLGAQRGDGFLRGGTRGAEGSC